MNKAWQEEGVGKPIVSNVEVSESRSFLLLRRVMKSRVGCGDTGVAAHLKQCNNQG